MPTAIEQFVENTADLHEGTPLDIELRGTDRSARFLALFHIRLAADCIAFVREVVDVIQGRVPTTTVEWAERLAARIKEGEAR